VEQVIYYKISHNIPVSLQCLPVYGGKQLIHSYVPNKRLGEQMLPCSQRFKFFVQGLYWEIKK